MISTVLVTGANGFVGHALCDELERARLSVRRAVRRARTPREFEVGEIGPQTDWRYALDGCDVIVHLAARVHVMRDRSSDPLAAFREVNTQGSARLATVAAESGVRRLIFISSIKVNGEAGVFSDTDKAAPEDPYAISKWEAEARLREIAGRTNMELAILRPPLVYGPGVGANFWRLMRSVDRGIPLPFGAVKNRRSLVFLGNLVDAIKVCLDHPHAAGKTCLVSDGQDVSTPELVKKIAQSLERPPRLLSVPPELMRIVGRLVGRGQEVERLLGSLAIEDGILRKDLGWVPPFTMQAGLDETVKWYRARAHL